MTVEELGKADLIKLSEMICKEDMNPEGLLENIEDYAEDDVVLKYKGILEKEGCTIEDFCIGHKRGIDIQATTKSGLKIIVEAKGTQGTKKSRNSAMLVGFQAAIGELLQRGHLAEEGYLNIILLPLNKKFLKLVTNQSALQSIKLKLVFALLPKEGKPLYLLGSN